MNPHLEQSASPVALVRSLWQARQLIAAMAQREVLGRYRGSAMGLLWSFLHPLFLLAVYTFVFSVVFRARWATSAGAEESRTLFALLLFTGMIVHGLFAEVLNRAPSLIVSNPNFVTKVRFPLEILPVVNMLAALFHAGVSLSVLLATFLIFNGFLPWTAALIPIILLPLAIFTLGLAWFLASLGVFIRDVSQTIGLVTMAMLFVSPVFFPVSAVPSQFQNWMLANPLTFIIEEARGVLIFGRLPDWWGISLYFACASLVAWLGFAWFQRTRKGFADVL